jgi:hypothetical protein
VCTTPGAAILSSHELFEFLG